MRSYRLVLVLKSDLKKEKKGKLLEDVKKWVGKVASEKVSEVGERKFAYAIKRAQKGEYVALEFNSESVAADFEKRILMEEDILRHLLVRIK